MHNVINLIRWPRPLDARGANPIPRSTVLLEIINSIRFDSILLDSSRLCSMHTVFDLAQHTVRVQYSICIRTRVPCLDFLCMTTTTTKWIWT